MSTLWILFFEFFKIGLFSIGGGLATIPFLMELANRYPWFDQTMLTNMIAVSESTPGPIGINMATFAGFQASGILGGIVASISLVVPSFFIIIAIAKVVQKRKDSVFMATLFTYLRPTTAAMIASVLLTLLGLTLFEVDALGTFAFFKVPSLLLFGVMLWFANWKPLHPIVYLLICMVVGILFPL
ncbi:MAG: chromate transporter [Erysipelotrichaceae bacterium]